MEIAIVSMSRINEKFPRLEHCCEGLCEQIVFHPEIHLVLAYLKEKNINAKFYDGGLINEEDILKELKKEKPKKILYYVNTPYINRKREFINSLGKISNLFLVVVPFFWREKILKGFPIVKGVFYDGEKALGINVSNAKINYKEINLEPFLGRDYSFPIVISKYCPYSCTYCVAQKTGLMERDLNIIEEELKELKELGFNRFSLMSNDLTLKKERFIKICEIMKGIDAEWSGDGRVNTMDNEMYNALENSKGILLFGIESANLDILNKIQKRITKEQIIKNAEELNKRKIPFRYTFMFGFPWDSKETANEMIDLRKKLGALNYHCLALSPLPGTLLFEEMKKLNLIREEELGFEDFANPYNIPLSGTLNLTKQEVQNEIKRITKAGALSWSVIKNRWKMRKKGEEFSLIKKGIKVLLKGERP